MQTWQTIQSMPQWAAFSEAVRKIGAVIWDRIYEAYFSSSMGEQGSLLSLALAAVYISLSIKNGIGYDFAGVVDEKFKTDRSWRGYLHWIYPRKAYLSKSVMQDLKISLSNTLLSGPLLLLYIPIYSSDFVQELLTRHVPPLFHLNMEAVTAGSGNYLLDLVYAFSLLLAYDIQFYLVHTCLHRIPWLWEFHKVHHSSTVMTGFTYSREHFCAEILNALGLGCAYFTVSLLFYYFLGYSPLGTGNLLVLASFALLVYGPNVVLYHSHMWISFGKLENLIQSPALHIIHHSVDPKHFNKNLGGLSTLWDRLFGTLEKSSVKPPEGFKIGVVDDFDFNSASIFKVYWVPIKRSIQILLGKREPFTTGMTESKSG